MEDAQVSIFHFCCHICGAKPGSQSLRTYLESWSESPPDRLRALLGIFAGALQESTTGQCRWKTKKFVRAAEKALGEAACLPEWLYSGPEPTLSIDNTQTLVFTRTCPVCQSSAGRREHGNYFTAWSSACKVQTGNLLYETGLVLWGVLKALPSWASGEVLTSLNRFRLKVVRVYRDLGMMECPQCGRPVTCLFGGTKEGQVAFCRHCADMGGGFWPGVRIEIGEDLAVSFTPTHPNPKAPAENSRDVLPPDVISKVPERSGGSRTRRST